jgi:hypothetical protein
VSIAIFGGVTPLVAANADLVPAGCH